MSHEGAFEVMVACFKATVKTGSGRQDVMSLVVLYAVLPVV